MDRRAANISSRSLPPLPQATPILIVVTVEFAKN